MKTVLIAGEINVDLVFGGCSAMPRADTEALAESFCEVPGSSSMICAMGLARLGRPVLFAGHAGADEHGRFCVESMRTAGIEVDAVRQRGDISTGITVALSTSEGRALVTFPGGIASLSAEEIDDTLLARAQHLHVSSYYLQRRLRPGLAGLFARARKAGMTTSLDPGFDPERRWRQNREWEALLAEVDVFLPNRGELCAIAGKAEPSAALDALSNGSTCIAVKCGADGAALGDGAGNKFQVPACALPQVCDSTGAGDSFNAGFLHAWLAGRPARECLRWGNACGALSTRGFGGTACQPSAAEARAWLDAGKG